jgi:hypothetical protein
LTHPIKSSDLWRILLSRIPLSELQATRTDELQVQRQSVLYADAVKWLEGILSSRVVVQAAKEYLVRTGNYSNILTVRYYLYFVRAIWHYLNQNKATAQTNIEALYSQFVAWGYNADILSALGFLQGVVIL